MLKEQYQAYIATYSEEIASLKKRNTTFILLEITMFAAAAAFLVCCAALSLSPWGWCAAVALAFYFLIRHFDDKNGERIRQASTLRSVCEDELRALSGDFSSFDDGQRYQDPHHPYAFDLDMYGKNSLFQRVNRTITTGGADTLAQMIAPVTFPQVEEITARRQLQQELSLKVYAPADNFVNGDEPTRTMAAQHPLHWRIHFIALGRLADAKKTGNRIETQAVEDAVRKIQSVDIPSWFGSRTSLCAAWLACLGLAAAVVLAAGGYLSSNIPLWWMLGQFAVTFGVCKQTLDKIASSGEQLRRQLLAYTSILRLVAGTHFDSALGQQMQHTLKDALPSFSQLEKILKGYDRRGNFLGLFFTDAFLLSDFFLVRQFLHWKHAYLAEMDKWTETVSQLDAFVSMADFRYNHPQAKEAELVTVPSVKEREGRGMASAENRQAKEGDGVFYEAKNICHPFLNEKAVKNDFVIHDRNYYIVTGANMAGKSTFLRCIGINYVLAMAGMPVFADSLRVSRFSLFSSMRTTDDLTKGISYFNAELLRLEQLIGFCQRSPHTLIILDEILKGTNSLDKLNGSRLFLEHISHLPVSGIIATHDLELSRMEDNVPDRFHNFCFEIDLGDDVTYSYKIAPGVARNQNATFLLKRILGTSS